MGSPDVYYLGNILYSISATSSRTFILVHIYNTVISPFCFFLNIFPYIQPKKHARTSQSRDLLNKVYDIFVGKEVGRENYDHMKDR